LFEKLTLICHSGPPPDLVNTLILGLISLTTLVSFISIIAPISQWIHFCVLGFLLLYAFHDKKNVGNAIKAFILDVKTNPYLFILGCICLFPAILISSGPVGYHDTGMYHAQAVKWINEYGTVPGLGNLHYRLAFNSSWFFFSAFFDVLAFNGKTSHLINLIPFNLLLCICFSGFYNISKGNISITHILKCLIILPIFTNRFLTIVFIPSLSPDLIVVILILYVLILTVEYVEQRQKVDNAHIDNLRETYVLIFCISLFLPTIKLSSLPILLFPLFILLKAENRKMKLLLTSSLCGVIILFPFLVGNVILSGYLLFPFPQLDLFSFDWKVPYRVADNVQRSIKYFAINPMTGGGIWAVSSMGTREWIHLWLGRSGGKLINYWTITALVSAIVFLLICFVRKIKVCLNILVIQGILLVSIVYWIFSAPAYRFGVAWIWAFIIFSYGNMIYLVLKDLRLHFINYLSRSLFILICVLLLNLLLLRWDSFQLLTEGYTELLWTIRPLPSEKTHSVEIHKGLVVNVPDKERAWDAELPTSPYVNHKLQQRGNTPKKGFRLTE
jgi:hypothetical protein